MCGTHAVYFFNPDHYLHLDVYDAGDVIANTIALAATVLLPLWVLFVILTGRASEPVPR